MDQIPSLRARLTDYLSLERGGLLWKISPQAPFVMATVIGLIGTIVFAATVAERFAS